MCSHPALQAAWGQADPSLLSRFPCGYWTGVRGPATQTRQLRREPLKPAAGQDRTCWEAPSGSGCCPLFHPVETSSLVPG